MFLFKKVADLHHFLHVRKKQGQTVGFVPTMGALHQGHATLVRQASNATDIAVCSIFVNPTQFNEATDLRKYPRTPEKDIALLLESGCSVLFLPDVPEVYPDGQQSKLDIDFEQLDQPMEGVHRPGHFKGMAQVVKRLLDIVQPDQLFMGQKDYQQFAIVQHLISVLHLPVKLVMSATVREPDGLAMSSRNMHLSPDQRAIAPLVFQTLNWAKEALKVESPPTIAAAAMKALTVPGIVPEYFEIVDGKTLQSIENLDEHDHVVACTAVKVGEVRLIDNLEMKNL